MKGNITGGGVTDIPGTSSSITWNGNTDFAFGTTANWSGGGGLAGAGGNCPVAFGCGVNAVVASAAGEVCGGEGSVQGAGSAQGQRAGDAEDPRRGDCDDFSGADDQFESGVHDRRSDY